MYIKGRLDGVAAMSEMENIGTNRRLAKHELQGKALQQKESELGKLSAQQNREEFFKQIIPLLNHLKSYIKRLLRTGYLALQVRTPFYTSADILDQVILRAYGSYDNKPEGLTLEQWLYQIANETVKRYISKEESKEARQRSFETLTQAELRTLEEIPFTADAEGEVWFPEELDDSEYQLRDFVPPTSPTDPEKQLEREEKVNRILQALSRVPEPDRIVFDLFLLEGFSKEVVAQISHVSPDEVPRSAERVRAHVLREIRKQPAGVPQQEKAS
jgi:RNA polymerase sigma factor (sigma-70 family)